MRQGDAGLQQDFSCIRQLRITCWTKNKVYLNGTNHSLLRKYFQGNTLSFVAIEENHHPQSNILHYLRRQTVYSLFAMTSSRFQYKSLYYPFYLIINQNGTLTSHYLLSSLTLTKPIHYPLSQCYQIFVGFTSNLSFSDQNLKIIGVCQLILLYRFIIKQNPQLIFLLPGFIGQVFISFSCFKLAHVFLFQRKSYGSYGVIAEMYDVIFQQCDAGWGWGIVGENGRNKYFSFSQGSFLNSSLAFSMIVRYDQHSQ